MEAVLAGIGPGWVGRLLPPGGGDSGIACLSLDSPAAKSLGKSGVGYRTLPLPAPFPLPWLQDEFKASQSASLDNLSQILKKKCKGLEM